MHAVNRISFCLALAINIAVALIGQQVTYGKYYSNYANVLAKDVTDNSYYLYLPPSNLQGPTGKMPLVMHFYGNGWKLGQGPFKYGSSTIGHFIANGIAVASVGYRRITVHYWYDVNGQSVPEEFINIDANGFMSLDTTGKTFQSYPPRVARHELLTKPTYDSVTALQHLISNADTYGVDMHRVVFWCFSAGGTMVQYLTYVYHQSHQDTFTPAGMTYDACMLDVPTANILDQVWGIVASNTVNGPETKLADLITPDICWWVVGSGCGDPRFSKWFSPDMSYSTCNITWNQNAVQRFCGDNFGSVTVGDLQKSQIWLEDTEYAKGLTKIWYASRNILQYTPRHFHVYLQNTADAYGLLHSPIYSAEYKKLFDKVGVQYTMYYDAVAGMVEPAGASPTMVARTGYQEKYISSHNWKDQLSSMGWNSGTWMEPVWYACFALQQPTCSPVQVAAPPPIASSLTKPPAAYQFYFHGACSGTFARYVTGHKSNNVAECSLAAMSLVKSASVSYFSFSEKDGGCAFYTGLCTAGDERKEFNTYSILPQASMSTRILL